MLSLSKAQRAQNQSGQDISEKAIAAAQAARGPRPVSLRAAIKGVRELAVEALQAVDAARADLRHLAGRVAELLQADLETRVIKLEHRLGALEASASEGDGKPVYE